MLTKLEADREVRLSAIPKEITKLQRKQTELQDELVTAMANFAAIQFLVNGIHPDQMPQAQMLPWEARQFFTTEVSRIQKERGFDGQPLTVQISALRYEATSLEKTNVDINTVETTVARVREAKTKEAREFVVAQG